MLEGSWLSLVGRDRLLVFAIVGILLRMDTFKCNVDVALVQESGQVGIGMVGRDDRGEFFACRMVPIKGRLTVCEAEAIGLQKAMAWVHGLNELDAKVVVDALQSRIEDATDFGGIIRESRDLLALKQSFSMLC
ncbi:hypothetical protein PTKIN_Ptkin02bG0163100 [Pterospermum kingtungense]